MVHTVIRNIKASKTNADTELIVKSTLLTYSFVLARLVSAGTRNF